MKLIYQTGNDLSRYIVGVHKVQGMGGSKRTYGIQNSKLVAFCNKNCLHSLAQIILLLLVIL